MAGGVAGKTVLARMVGVAGVAGKVGVAGMVGKVQVAGEWLVCWCAGVAGVAGVAEWLARLEWPEWLDPAGVAEWQSGGVAGALGRNVESLR